jgi:hypothetical protein
MTDRLRRAIEAVAAALGFRQPQLVPVPVTASRPARAGWSTGPRR